MNAMLCRAHTFTKALELPVLKGNLLLAHMLTEDSGWAGVLVVWLLNMKNTRINKLEKVVGEELSR